MAESFFHVGDRVTLAKPDGDGHVLSREDDGVIVAVVSREEVVVLWDAADRTEILSDNDLDLI